ncbi:MAG: phosphoribosylaminoimidazolesuccinocarboxamide synthase [Myxococcales bacterium]|nr:phosphoribosylaminoimidazolesuccinocarboxamide synthase [Myxococcales bacterium]
MNAEARHLEAIQAALARGDTLDALGPEFDALGRRYEGKVRENFTRDGERIIIVTDRVSAFDVILGTIPFKGQVLGGLASHWFSATRDLARNHLIESPDLQVMRVVECALVPVEFVVRGYLTGVSGTSIWTAYARGDREFCGHPLPEGMRRHQRLPTPLVTPTTKAPKGEHDLGVSRAWIVERGLLSADDFDLLAARALTLFARGQALARERGLLLVDTKYEFGKAPDGEYLVIDEIHTPDSSRYWFADGYEDAYARGDDPKSMDKEFVRRWLAARGYRGDGPPPPLPDEVRIEAALRYIETYERVTGTRFTPALEPPIPRLRRLLLER